MKARLRLRIAAWICLAGVVIAAGFALREIVPQILWLMSTKTVEASVVTKPARFGQVEPVYEIIREHDADGYVIYGLRVPFSYTVNGAAHVATAETPYRTRNVVEILRIRDPLTDLKPRPIRYLTGNVEKIYLDTGIPARAWRPALESALAASGFGILAFIFFRWSRRPRLCAACKFELEDYFKFCPGCGETVPKK